MNDYHPELLPVISGRHYLVATDGAAKGNPGPGGWGMIKQLKDGSHLLRQGANAGHSKAALGETITTNVKMEMFAAISAVESIAETDTPMIVITDSQLVYRGITEWLPRWKVKGWVGSNGPVKNRTLWERLDAACMGKTIHWVWVRGHAGHDLNEMADTLAGGAARGMYPRGRNSVLASHPDWFVV